MTEINYVHLPKTIENGVLLQQAHRMRDIRLLSLRTDPSSFSSRYEDEKDQPIQFSVNRIKDPNAEHFVAIVAPQEAKSNNAKSDTYDAVLVMTKTELSELVSKTVREYNLAAVYVRKVHRGKGICSRLVQEAVSWVQQDFRQAGYQEAIIHITATAVNVSAHRLYQRLGFELVAHSIQKTKADEDLPIVKMKLHLV